MHGPLNVKYVYTYIQDVTRNKYRKHFMCFTCTTNSGDTQNVVRGPRAALLHFKAGRHQFSETLNKKKKVKIRRIITLSVFLKKQYSITLCITDNATQFSYSNINSTSQKRWPDCRATWFRLGIGKLCGQSSRNSDSLRCWMVCRLNPEGSEIFLHRPDWALGPSSLLYHRHRVSFSEVKRPGSDDQPPHLVSTTLLG